MSYRDYKDLCEYPFERVGASNAPCALDTETLGRTRATNLPIYYSWAARDLPAGAGPTVTQPGLDFLEALCKSKRPKVFQNAKFDLRVLRNIGLEVNGEIHDTLLMHSLLDEHHFHHHALKPLSRELLGRTREDEFALHANQQRGDLVNLNTPQEFMHPYSVADAQDTIDLFYLFEPQLRGMELWNLYRNEIAAMLAYLELDMTGVLMDKKAIYATLENIKEPLAQLIQRVYETFGEEFKLSSPRQLGDVLAKHFPLREQTASGSWKTDKATLGIYADNPKMQPILAWRFLNRARTTLEGYLKRIEEDGRMHPDYRQATITGRSQCSEPNLQAIPKRRGKLGAQEVGSAELAEICADAFRMVRKAFVVPEGFEMLAMDYKQVEYRVFAYYSGSERLIQRLQQGEDFHELTCQIVFEDYNEKLRHIIKDVNYGLIYGMGEPKLCLRLRDYIPDPRGILQKYERNLPEMRSTQKAIIRQATLRGYVVDVFGRRYRMQKERPYAIVSWLCQGTAANVKKTSLARVQNLLKAERARTRLIMDIHDELVMELHADEKCLVPKIKAAMEDYPQFGAVPLPVDIEIGPNLLETKGVDLNAKEFSVM